MTQTEAKQTPPFALEPEPPRDALAAATSPEAAVARHLAVLGLPLEERGQRLLRALSQLDFAIEQGPATTHPAPGAEPFVLEEVEPEPSDHESDGFTPEAAAADVATDPNFHTKMTQRLPNVMEQAAAQGQIAAQGDVAEQFVRAGGRDRHQFAAAETIVLSGPDIKRKIRHKQSIMPSHVSQVLYEDIGALFEIGDREGALISLERLLTVAPISPQIETFLAHNEARLLEYYESVLGPWTRVVTLRAGEGAMPEPYFRLEKLAKVVSLLDGQRPLSRVLAEAGLRHIETCAVLSQLARSASLDLGMRG